MKLGEALVKNGLITKDHLRRALERQVIFGGRIGTNIVELGILKEEELAKFLSGYFKIPSVKPSELADVETEVIASISKDIAEKYRMIPFKREKNRLHVAMLDAKDVQTLDEIRFLTGFDVIPYVSSELRILFLLEKYYGIKRDVRFISLLDRGEEEEDAPVVESVKMMASPKEAPPEPQVNAQPSPRPAPGPQAPPAVPEPPIKPVHETDPEKILLKAKEAFASVSDRDEVAGILVSEAHRGARRVSLFMVKGSEIRGWRCKGIETSPFNSKITAPSHFHDVLTDRNYYRGPVLNVPGNKDLIDALGGTPQDSLFVPVSIRDRIIGILYADNGNDSVLDANLAYVNTLSQLASLAFELIIIKKKMADL